MFRGKLVIYRCRI